MVSNAALTLGAAALPAVSAPADPGDSPGDFAPAADPVMPVRHAAKQDDPVERAAAPVRDLGKADDALADASQGLAIFTSKNLATTHLRQFASGFVGPRNHGDNDLTEFRNIRVREL